MDGPNEDVMTMTDTERLDWLEKTMRRELGGKTPERYVSCAVHRRRMSLREAVDFYAAKFPDGNNPRLYEEE